MAGHGSTIDQVRRREIVRVTFERAIQATRKLRRAFGRNIRTGTAPATKDTRIPDPEVGKTHLKVRDRRQGGCIAAYRAGILWVLDSRVGYGQSHDCANGRSMTAWARHRIAQLGLPCAAI
jgi:hypothetical protein